MKFKPKKHKKEDHSKRTRNILWAVFITVLFVGSYFGYTMLQNPTSEDSYNGTRFEIRDNMYYAKINGIAVAFYYHPTQLSLLNVSPDIPNIITSNPILYLTSDVQDNLTEAVALSKYELSNLLSTFFTVHTINAFTENTTYNLSTVTCLNATGTMPVLYFRESNETSIVLNSSCIIINAKNPRDVIAAKDRLSYAILGIMK
jgi:hypothetical protein